MCKEILYRIAFNAIFIFLAVPNIAKSQVYCSTYDECGDSRYNGPVRFLAYDVSETAI